MKLIPLTLTVVLLSASLYGQDRKDQADYRKAPENVFYQNIQQATDSFYKSATKEEEKKKLMLDVAGMDLPRSVNEFTIIETEQPESQGITGTCWSFSTTSFFESEIYRLQQKTIPLAEIHIVYWQYIEKARRFVRTRGVSLFDEGSETNAAQAMMKKYGIVPQSAYTGFVSALPFHDHSIMVNEMKQYLQSIARSKAWNEQEIIATISSIMDHYIGTPPSEFSYQNKTYTPLTFMQEVTRLRPDDYVTFMSLKSEPFWTQAMYKVPDNWWYDSSYYNLPVTDFLNLIKHAVQSGYSISIGGDVSESGNDLQSGIMMVPSYDIPSSFIDDNARLLRFLNGATTDDHAMHLVGFTEKENGTWFLVKDSGSGGHNNETGKGYWYMHEDYVKLKIMTATMHRDAAQEWLKKFK